MSDYKPFECMMTHSTCYKGTHKMKVKGVLWHSTGANNWNIKRYCNPYEGDPGYAEKIAKIGKNGSNDWNHIYKNAGLNAWIGKFKDGTVGTAQAMPWDFAPWGCGRGKNGSCNNSHVQFEICEEFLINNRSHNKNTPGDKEYAQQVWDEAVRFTAYICEMYDIDPLGYVMINGVKVPTILDHKTSWELGLGSGHGDIRHWFPVVLGKDMADARQEVYNLMHSKQGKGWKKEGNNWYYYDASGKKVVGWQTIDGDTYYFDKDGVMQTGWLDYDGAKYYFGTNGKRVVDWKKIDGVWYFFDTDGKMVATKWVRYNGAWYYLTDDGKMAVGWLNLDDGTYYCNASGAAVTGWKRVDRLWYYFDSNCRMVKSGWITIDDTKYYLYPSDGHMASAEWIEGLWCDYNGAQGYEYKGEWKSNAKGKWWEDESGWYPKNTTQKIDGVEYQFDEKGYLIQ